MVQKMSSDPFFLEKEKNLSAFGHALWEKNVSIEQKTKQNKVNLNFNSRKKDNELFLDKKKKKKKHLFIMCTYTKRRMINVPENYFCPS